MKRLLMIFVGLSLAVASAQNPPAPAGAKPATAPAGQTAPPATAPARPTYVREAKSQAEVSDYTAAIGLAQNNDMAGAEKAAADFETKFPDSELKAGLYNALMTVAYNAGNNQKALELGRKALKFEPNNTHSLVVTSEILAQDTKDTDLDRDEKYSEGFKNAENAVNTVDSGMALPANIPPERVEQLKKIMVSRARSNMGYIELRRKNFAAAEDHLRKSLAIDPTQADPSVYLWLAVVLDGQHKYTEAMAYTEKAIAAANASQMADTLERAKAEKTRLQALLPSK